MIEEASEHHDSAVSANGKSGGLINLNMGTASIDSESGQTTSALNNKNTRKLKRL